MSHGYDPLDLKGQHQQAARNRTTAEASRKEEVDDIKWLMGSKRGRRIIWRLLGHCGVFRSSFTGNSETFFREGQRNIGLMLTDVIHAGDPDLYAAMVKEHQTHERHEPGAE